MPPRLFIEPRSGYTPTIGRLVGMLDYARGTTLRAVDGLTTSDLDHLHDAASNSIGALLAHIATVERAYQVLTFEERPPSEFENAAWAAALNLGDEGRRALRGQPLEHYLEQLATTRAATLQALASRDDEWLERPMARAAHGRGTGDERALGMVPCGRGRGQPPRPDPVAAYEAAWRPRLGHRRLCLNRKRSFTPTRGTTVQRKKAIELQKAWGTRPCEHPSFSREYDQGERTGNYCCTKCGASLTFREKAELTAARAAAPSSPRKR